jgi:hypothetical protein
MKSIGIGIAAVGLVLGTTTLAFGAESEGSGVCMVPCPLSDRSWHLLTQTEGGTVSLLKDLTKHECEFAMHRARGEPATEAEIAAAKERGRKRAEANARLSGSSGDGHYILPGDIKSAECFQ